MTMSQKRFTGAKIVLIGAGGVGKTGNIMSLYVSLLDFLHKTQTIYHL